jgi:hypothetical protein
VAGARGSGRGEITGNGSFCLRTPSLLEGSASALPMRSRVGWASRPPISASRGNHACRWTGCIRRDAGRGGRDAHPTHAAKGNGALTGPDAPSRSADLRTPAIRLFPAGQKTLKKNIAPPAGILFKARDARAIRPGRVTPSLPGPHRRPVMQYPCIRRHPFVLHPRFAPIRPARRRVVGRVRQFGK